MVAASGWLVPAGAWWVSDLLVGPPATQPGVLDDALLQRHRRRRVVGRPDAGILASH
jgi:hypothetical protein